MQNWWWRCEYLNNVQKWASTKSLVWANSWNKLILTTSYYKSRPKNSLFIIEEEIAVSLPLVSFFHSGTCLYYFFLLFLSTLFISPDNKNVKLKSIKKYSSLHTLAINPLWEMGASRVMKAWKVQISHTYFLKLHQYYFARFKENYKRSSAYKIIVKIQLLKIYFKVCNIVFLYFKLPISFFIANCITV